MRKYYRKPSFVILHQSDYTFAFTMRLINTLFDFNLVKRDQIIALDVQLYARRFPRYYIDVDPQEEAYDSKREDPTDL